MGFCWGGWVGAHILASDMADEFRCCTVPHPSIHLENFCWGNDIGALVEKVRKPMMWLPAKVSGLHRLPSYPLSVRSNRDEFLCSS